MALDEFLGDMLDAGARGRRWRSWWSILGALVGAGLGLWLSLRLGQGTPVAAAGATVMGGLTGWVVAMILRGLLDRVEPTLKDMGEDLDGLMADMEPALRDLAGLIGDIRNYHPPEMLPNGDIILRRKAPLDPGAAAPDGGGPIDL